MANVLVVAELAEDGKLKKSTLSAITFARQALPAVGGSLSIVVLGASTAAASCAWTRPTSFSGMSLDPWSMSSRFQSVWPWRMKANTASA